MVTAGPEPEIDGVVRWRCADLATVIKARFGVDYPESSIGKLLRSLGFSHVSARPRHPKQDPEAIEAFKKGSVYKLYAFTVCSPPTRETEGSNP